MMVLVTGDIFFRKFFNAPIQGTLEITESLLTFLIYFGVAYTQLEGSHVRVTLLTDRLPLRSRRIFLIGVYFIAVVFFLYVSYCMFSFAWDSWEVRESKWGSIKYPLYPVKALAGVGAVLLAFQFLLDLIKELFDLFRIKEQGAKNE
jgi:TRAP-type C4-dicarboxylate transport system permease small subunit